MQDLKITLIQSELVWEDIEANLAGFERKISSIPPDTDLIVLPEMFTTGFSMNPAGLAQDMQGSTVKWLQAAAQQRQADITGSVIIRAGDRFFNRLLWAKPDGRLLSYDKRHLFRMLGEEKVYSPGSEILTVELHGWKLRPFICYDLRFPVWTRNVANGYDAAIFVANWPAKRAAHWQALLKARAIENLSYVVAVNRVGIDGNGLDYSGDSCVLDPAGELLFQASHQEAIQTTVLSYARLQTFRTAFPAWQDADAHRIEDLQSTR